MCERAALSKNYAFVGLGLSPTRASNYSIGGNLLGTASIPAGGFNFGTALTLTLYTPFTYTPGNGDLILEIVVDSQNIVPNGSGNGYNWADYTGVDTSRAYCLTSIGCVGGVNGALVTAFNGTPVFQSEARW